MESIFIFLLFILGATFIYYSKIIPYYLWRDPKDKEPHAKVYLLFAVATWIVTFALLVLHYVNVFGVDSTNVNPF